MGMLVPVLAAWLPLQLSANVCGKAAQDGPAIWAPATHVGDPHGVLGSWLQTCPAAAIVGIWGVNG